MRWIGAVAVVPVAAGMLAALARINRTNAARHPQAHGAGPGTRAS
jgi:hypothetical protein